jgi:hypothetical protein
VRCKNRARSASKGTYLRSSGILAAGKMQALPHPLRDGLF